MNGKSEIPLAVYLSPVRQQNFVR